MTTKRPLLLALLLSSTLARTAAADLDSALVTTVPTTESPFAITEPVLRDVSALGLSFSALVLTDEGSSNGLRSVNCTTDYDPTGPDPWEQVHGTFPCLGCCTLSANQASNLFGLAERLFRPNPPGDWYGTATGVNPQQTFFCPKLLRLDAQLALQASSCLANDVDSLSNSLSPVGDQLCNATYGTAAHQVRVHCAPLSDLSTWTLRVTIDNVGGPNEKYPHFRVFPFVHPQFGENMLGVAFAQRFSATVNFALYRESDWSFAAGGQLSSGGVDLSNVPSGSYLDLRVAMEGSDRLTFVWGNDDQIDFAVVSNLGLPGAQTHIGTAVPAGGTYPGAWLAATPNADGVRFFYPDADDDLLVGDIILKAPPPALPAVKLTVPLANLQVFTASVPSLRTSAFSDQYIEGLLFGGGSVQVVAFNPAPIFANGFELESLAHWSTVVGGPP